MKQTRQAKQAKPTRTILAHQEFSCPNCSKQYHRGDRFCGFCQQPLQLQCSHCGRWTKANHTCCPDCGSLLRGSFSFDEKRQLEILRQTHQNLQLDCADSGMRLQKAHRRRRQAIVRLIVAGVLIGAILVCVPMAIANLAASLAGILFLLVVLFVFRRLSWGLPRLIGHFWRWVAPNALAHWSQAIEEEQELLSSLEVELDERAREIAALEPLDPACLTEEEEDWEKVEADWEDASALVASGEEEEQETSNQESEGQMAGKRLIQINMLWRRSCTQVVRLAHRVFPPKATEAQSTEPTADKALPAEEKGEAEDEEVEEVAEVKVEEEAEGTNMAMAWQKALVKAAKVAQPKRRRKSRRTQ